MSNELKRCPFCGSPAVSGGFSIQCSVCPAVISGLNHAEVVQAWNRRPPDRRKRVVEKQTTGEASFAEEMAKLCQARKKLDEAYAAAIQSLSRRA